MAVLKDTIIFGNLTVTGSTNLSLVKTYIWTNTLDSGASIAFDLSTIKLGGLCDKSFIQVWVQDTESGSSTLGKFINADAISTIVSDGTVFTIYNDHSATLTFKVNIICL